MADLPDFQQVIVLFNPASTRAKLSRQRIKELKRLYPHKVEVVETSADGREANLELIRKLGHRLKPHSLLCVAAGDGTVSLAVEALAATGKQALPRAGRQAVLFPMWGGNANDLAHMLNGLVLRRRMATFVAKATVVPIHPLVCTIKDIEGKTTTRIAACYITFGFSASMARHLNDADYRKKASHRSLANKLLHELSHLFKAIKQAERFSYSENHQTHRAYELIFANGSRIAKVDRLPISLSEKYFYKNNLEYKRFGAIVNKLIAVISDKQPGHKLNRQVHLNIHDPVWAQVDGEPLAVEAGSRVTISVNSRPFFALASSLRQPSDKSS